MYDDGSPGRVKVDIPDEEVRGVLAAELDALRGKYRDMVRHAPAHCGRCAELDRAARWLTALMDKTHMGHVPR